MVTIQVWWLSEPWLLTGKIWYPKFYGTLDVLKLRMFACGPKLTRFYCIFFLVCIFTLSIYYRRQAKDTTGILTRFRAAEAEGVSVQDREWSLLIVNKQLCNIIGQINDFLQLDDVAMKSESILIVGGGFLGSELAVGLASRGE